MRASIRLIAKGCKGIGSASEKKDPGRQEKVGGKPGKAKQVKNRADWIRTSDLLNPIQAHYQAVLRPDVDPAQSGGGTAQSAASPKLASEKCG